MLSSTWLVTVASPFHSPHFLIKKLVSSFSQVDLENNFITEMLLGGLESLDPPGAAFGPERFSAGSAIIEIGLKVPSFLIRRKWRETDLVAPLEILVATLSFPSISLIIVLMRDASGMLKVEIGGRTFDSIFLSQDGMDMVVVEVEAIALITLQPHHERHSEPTRWVRVLAWEIMTLT